MAEHSHPGPLPPEQMHPEQDLLVGVALGHAPLEQRDQVTSHLAVCATCRREYGEIADSIELVLPAVPRIAPPSGFDADVLARLAAEREGPRPATAVGEVPAVANTPAVGDTPAPAEQHDRHHRHHRRPVRWAVAAGLAGLAIGAGAAVGLGGGDRPVPVATSQWQAPLVDTGGEAVGTVTHSWNADGPALVVQIDEGPAGYEYTCRLVLADGTVREVGQWQLAEDRPNSWVVPAAADVEVVEMVTEDGDVWSSAEF